MLNPHGDNGILDQRVSANHVNRLGSLLIRKRANRAPYKLQTGRGVLSTAIANNPWNIIAAIQLLDLRLQGLYRSSEAS